MQTCGVVEYINAIPWIGAYLLGALKSEFTFKLAPPRDLNYLMQEKKLAISFVSAIYYLQNKDHLELIPGIGIGSERKVLSVSLFYQEKLSSFDGVTVALDPESATSNQIAKWLLTSIKKQNPNFIIPKSVNETLSHPAFLLIGDRCLAFGHPKGYKVMDLGEEWMNATGLPLPFGVFVAQKDFAKEHPEVIDHLKEDLLRSLSWGFKHTKDLYQLAKRQTNLSEEMVLNYWDHLAYIFDPRYKLALDKMEQQVIQ